MALRDRDRRLDPGIGMSLVRPLALLALCSAYIQGPVMKILDFPGAIAEMEHFGLRPPTAFAIGVIAFELAMSALVVIGIWRWAASLSLAAFTLAATLIALRFWEMPAGMPRIMATNGFFEHLGLVGAFVLVAAFDLRRRHDGQGRQFRTAFLQNAA